jgi:L-ascorbate metabolism protein UlaG (beta-lactamase superfamily)
VVAATAARRLLWAATLVVSAACRSAVPFQYQVEPVPAVVGCSDGVCADSDQVAITYLGVAGFVIAYRGHTLLTAPEFTNPSLDSVTPSRLRFFRGVAPDIVSDHSLVERLLPRAADDASMILVGHGHYDHLLDIPYIATRRATKATIYGSPTVRHMLMGDTTLRAEPARVVAIGADSVGSQTHAGRWFYNSDSTFRIMALAADHAPTVRLFGWGPIFANAVLSADLDRLPRKAEDWKLGETYTYIIDVLARGDTAPRFRAYFQDAPNTPPLGFPPSSALLGGRGFDVAILCVATARNTDPPGPDDLLRALKPRYVIGSHWESFFRPQILPRMLNPASDVDAFGNSQQRVLPASTAWSLPSPRTTLRFAARKPGS